MLKPFIFNWPWNARLVIPTSFEDCLTYGQRQEFMWREIQELKKKVNGDDENENEEDS